MQIHVAICDDEDFIRREIRNCVSKQLMEEGYDFFIEEFEEGSQILENQEIDILFLDIEMNGVDGISVKNKLCERDENTQIIFVTSHEECMPEAFGKNVFGFIKKPICEEYLTNKLEEVLCYLIKRMHYIVIEGSGGMQSISIFDITYIESIEKYSKIHTTNGECYFSNNSLGDWEKKLEREDFYRCHRKYLVGLWTIKKIADKVIFLNGDEIGFSRRNKEGLKQFYRQFIIRNAR